MTKYIINGGNVLHGDVRVSGAKNAILPVLSATLINKGITRITNCPDISDVRITAGILKDLGCKVNLIKKKEGNIIEVDATNIEKTTIGSEKARLCRSSITFLGAITARSKEAEVAFPGGCIIGDRPIDIHESLLREMGIETTRNDSAIKTKLYRTDCNVENDKHVYLKFPSVGATENALMAAAGLTESVTVYGAATEPEIVCLGNYLQKLGVKIQGLGTGCIKIRGLKEYKKDIVTFKIIPDRIEAATFLISAAGIGDNIKIHGCETSHCLEVINVLKRMGTRIKEHKYTQDGEAINFLEISETSVTKRLNSPGIIIADAYPAFPTDAQSLILPLLSVSKGETFVIDKIFPKRFKAADELSKMNADITNTDFGIHIRGRKHLTGNKVQSHDLRGGAAMVIAGLLAKGQTIVYDKEYIKRGYDGISEKLRALGADITESQNLS
ncbi:MAG: UDP-N-acetylglucosamine 1-carboxyvinyltransferase [Ruminococcaceae bacterium]|nr:UDP-N-acetylglucosamine 1-carboxyvinyltransferase [Oscillospiraceae bacterium]